MYKTSIQKSIKKWMHLGIDFWEDLGGFWEPKWSHVGTKFDEKSMPIAKSDFLKNRCFSLGKTTIFKVRGVQVGNKNRLKIDQKRSSTWEGILASIFERFCWILGAKLGSKIEPRSIQKCIEKTMKKRSAPKWQKSRSKTLRSLAPDGFQDPGEEVGGGVNPSPREGGKGIGAV